MIEITSWRRERRAFDRIRFTPPEGEEVGAIVIHERVRPLLPLQRLVDARLAPGGTRGQPIRLFTVEGELAAIIDFAADGVHHSLAVIYGDDFQTVLEGCTRRDDQRQRIHDVTREIAVHFPLGLGQKRHRRFWYQPPQGWQGLVRGLTTDWFPLDHPLNPATIRVLPARPMNGLFKLDTVLRDDTFADVAIKDVTRTPLDLTSFHGALGCAVTDEQAFLTAALEDRQYVYVLRLTTTNARLAADEPLFRRLLESIVPLPVPLPESSAATATPALDYWTT